MFPLNVQEKRPSYKMNYFKWYILSFMGVKKAVNMNTYKMQGKKIKESEHKAYINISNNKQFRNFKNELMQTIVKFFDIFLL